LETEYRRAGRQGPKEIEMSRAVGVLVNVVALLSVVATPAAGQRVVRTVAVAPLASAPPARRIPLPDAIAVFTDSTYMLVVPSLFERRAIYRYVDGDWTVSDRAIERDSVRGARLAGLPLALYAEGQPAGTARLLEVRPNFCADPPAWCPTRAEVEVLGELTEETPPIVAVGPPPQHASHTVEAEEEEASAAMEWLLGAFRAALRPRAVDVAHVGEPVVFAVQDTSGDRRVVVAGARYDLGAGGALSALVIGVAAGTVFRSVVGRTARLAPGATEELQFVSGFDLNGDDRDELLLGWLRGEEWWFEILSPDRLGRFTQHWRGPDRSLPVARPARR
jgi:hypothetical protein